MDTTETSASAFEMVAKTFQGLEGVLAAELRKLGAANVRPGNRMVAFEGDLEMLYRANICCRTALRILKPFYKFRASTPDELYEHIKAYDWSTLLSTDKTFSIDTVAFSEEFTHSRYATYRVKDAIADWFRDKYGPDARPRVRLENADVILNVHISGREVTVSLDSSGESLHRRGYRLGGQTEAPINEVLAAGILLMAGYDGSRPFLDPMCGSGTFVVEAALIAANINPGVFRSHYAFENWPDFDRALYESIYHDDSAERVPDYPIVGADIAPKAVEIARKNAVGAGVSHFVTIETRPLSQWTSPVESVVPGLIVTNPPYGQRISAPDMEGLYRSLGEKLKHVFTGWTAWVIGYRDEYFREIGLAPSRKEAINNGGLDCELREYITFAGNKRDFRAAGGRLKEDRPAPERRKDRKASAGKPADRKPFDKKKSERKPFDRKGADKKPYDRRAADKRDRRPVERTEKRAPRHFGTVPDNEPGERLHRPLRLDRMGSGPSIPAEKEQVINRPVTTGWRRRKTADNNTQE